MSEPILQLRDVHHYEQGRPTLNGIRLDLSARRRLAIAGETGSGKTTLLRVIAGLSRVDEGTIFFEGLRVKGPHERLLPGQPGIAYLSQQYEFPNHYRMEEILRFENRLPPAEEEELYRLCRIDHLLHRTTVQLSGGERQRMALARLLVGAPRLLLLDEPFSSLDAIHKSLLKSVLHDIGDRLRLTVILVSHEAPDLLSWADEIAVLRNGKLVQHGEPEDVYRRPADRYAAALLGPGTVLTPLEAAVFTGVVEESGYILIRPEEARIVTGGGVRGTVIAQSYYGGHYELAVALDAGPVLTCRHPRPIDTGTEAYVQVDRWWRVK